MSSSLPPPPPLPQGFSSLPLPPPPPPSGMMPPPPPPILLFPPPLAPPSTLPVPVSPHQRKLVQEEEEEEEEEEEDDTTTRVTSDSNHPVSSSTHIHTERIMTSDTTVDMKETEIVLNATTKEAEAEEEEAHKPSVISDIVPKEHFPADKHESINGVHKKEEDSHHSMHKKEEDSHHSMHKKEEEDSHHSTHKKEEEDSHHSTHKKEEDSHHGHHANSDSNNVTHTQPLHSSSAHSHTITSVEHISEPVEPLQHESLHVDTQKVLHKIEEHFSTLQKSHDETSLHKTLSSHDNEADVDHHKKGHSLHHLKHENSKHDFLKNLHKDHHTNVMDTHGATVSMNEHSHGVLHSEQEKIKKNEEELTKHSMSDIEPIEPIEPILSSDDISHSHHTDLHVIHSHSDKEMEKDHSTHHHVHSVSHSTESTSTTEPTSATSSLSTSLPPPPSSSSSSHMSSSHITSSQATLESHSTLHQETHALVSSSSFSSSSPPPPPPPPPSSYPPPLSTQEKTKLIDTERRALENEAASLRELSSDLRRELAELESDYMHSSPIETGDVAVTLREVIENVKALLQDSHKQHMKVTQAISKLRPISSSKMNLNETSYAAKMLNSKLSGGGKVSKVSPLKKINSPHTVSIPTRIPLEYVHESHPSNPTKEHIEEEKKKLAAYLQRVNDAKRASKIAPKGSIETKPGDRPPFSLSTMVDLPLSSSPRLPPPAFPASSIYSSFVSPSSLARFRSKDETTISASSSASSAESRDLWNAAFSSSTLTMNGSNATGIVPTSSSVSPRMNFSSPNIIKKPKIVRKTSPRTTLSPKTYTHTFSSGLKAKDIDAEGVSALASLKRSGTDPKVAVTLVERAQQRLVETLKFTRNTMTSPNRLAVPKK